MKYRIFTTLENEIPMIAAIKEMKIDGIMWPNRPNPEFNLTLTEEELLVLKLKVPISRCERY